MLMTSLSSVGPDDTDIMWLIAKRQLRIPGLHDAVAPIKRSAYVRVLQNRRARLPQVRRREKPSLSPRSFAFPSPLKQALQSTTLAVLCTAKIYDSQLLLQCER